MLVFNNDRDFRQKDEARRREEQVEREKIAREEKNIENERQVLASRLGIELKHRLTPFHAKISSKLDDVDRLMTEMKGRPDDELKDEVGARYMMKIHDELNRPEECAYSEFKNRGVYSLLIQLSELIPSGHDLHYAVLEAAKEAESIDLHAQRNNECFYLPHMRDRLFEAIVFLRTGNLRSWTDFTSPMTVTAPSILQAPSGSNKAKAE